MSSWIKKGVLHLDQKDFGGREKIERRERKEKEKGRGKEV